MNTPLINSINEHIKVEPLIHIFHIHIPLVETDVYTYKQLVNTQQAN